jgi:hypothetical protein
MSGLLPRVTSAASGGECDPRGFTPDHPVGAGTEAEAELED